MMKKKTISILFIGNSHTYYNDMPARVMQRAVDHGFDCRIAMLAHPGWYLDRHAGDPEAGFNIHYGSYDYVVLQEHAHPFDKLDKYHEAAEKLCGMPRALVKGDRVLADIIYRDGTLLDRIYNVR